MIKRVHPIAGFVAFLTILAFWTSTVYSELFGSVDMVVAVKKAIPWGFVILVPAMAITGASGFRLGGKLSVPLISAKKRRMPFIAINGLVILIPAALYLRGLAIAGDFSGRFYGVQAIELVAGFVNLMLLGLSIRDGLRFKGRIAKK